jgi:hypothetical protein
MRALLVAALALGSLAGCGKDDASPALWELTLTTSSGQTTTVAVRCAPDGVCPGATWNLASIASDGCLLQVSFDVHFAGTAVDLANFTRTTGSTCTGPGTPRGDAAGHGTADRAWPDAQSAEGRVTIGFIGVLYTPSGPPALNWRGRRLAG